MKNHIVVGAYIFNDEKVLLIHHKKLKLWLPVGGHIEEDELPDDAVKREAREEVGLEIELIETDKTQFCGAMKRKLATPFHVNLHNVGDHDHCCLFYLARSKTKEVNQNEKELTDYKWFTKEELNSKEVPADVKAIALTAFEILERMEKT